MTEYAVQKWDYYWRVHKLDDHHGSYCGYYEVRQSRQGNWYCTCIARFDCKHIKMAQEEKKK